ncbi:tryptophan ABC transporter substrate-binding protein [Enterococcus casseliflavus]|uniref:Tryptophan ABC transporter substrate-binding protein n=1 Tax=Enterococcus casseliflavus TaxID=37734 RepID=A0AAW8US11_ENTCA|nr:tryptophan ABC transporter substrate-binding protein [Enterococcus casseliflavus]MBO6357741.1 ABC transporter substrate-binding protein [Enterococcus casseliflavus]MBO6375122.1 ABC transporter substrate-binding protein [Enterococcus casseliflavus]MDT2965496.1 tryptophan ABC transporter substrate-binding protein [Enterococcus casseliflavus]OJG31581.1 ABC transporter substrate-binding protein [Enterococcus casseliflavus]QQU22238.1 ABC transporter substrate-binding protein [Enterococcus cassel
MKNKGLIASVAVILLFLGATFVYQLGMRSGTNQASETSEPVEKAEKTVGILQFVSHEALDAITEGIKEGLKESGYTEGDNLTIEFQNGQADQSKLATMSQQLLNKEADVLVGVATPAAQALANVTQDVPIVLGAVTDPVGANLVADMDQPGGNITGVSDKAPVAAQIKLAKDLLPEAKTVGILYSSTEDNSKYQVAEAEAAAEENGLTSKSYAVPSSNEIAQMVQVMAREVDFIYIPLDNTIANAMQTVVQEANKSKTPIITSVDTMVEQGGLATVGQDQFTIGVETGKMVAAILDGTAEPATTPIYTFSDGETIINETQAQLLGITIPENLKDEAKLITTTPESEASDE